MSSIQSNSNLTTESDVEQKFIYKLLTTPLPLGLGYCDSDIRTKESIKKLSIDKGNKKKLYYPDYAIVIDGLPTIIIEAKKPGENISEALREARLYATEINSSYKKNINPCSLIIATDGTVVSTCHWDHDTPFVEFLSEDIDPLNPDFECFVQSVQKSKASELAQEILKSIRKKATYFKPVSMLGGKSVTNETVGENSFGANVSLEYKYLFNPDKLEDREAIAKNAYVQSKRKQSHIAPIDKIIRAALPQNLIDAKKVEDTANPAELFEQLQSPHKIRNEICLLIGSVGSGKSTFTDHLRAVSLPDNIKRSTEWININLNKAPLSRDLIYNWVVEQAIILVRDKHKDIDFDHINTLKQIYSRQLSKLEKGRASLYPKDSERYTDIIFEELEQLQADKNITLDSIINHLYCGSNKLLIIVFDNCDKRVRDDQLLMFDVATWLKNTFPCMVFLPLRDSTYDQYCNEPPLDTVIKDLVFRIDPPLLERVIYSRLNYALREIKENGSNFYYYLPNNAKVECKRSEIGVYMKCMVASLFQDNLFKRIVAGLAGRNIRRGLEILLDFCKSGHIREDEIFKVRQSSGDYKLPHHLVARILLRGKRRYYNDSNSYIKNLFYSEAQDSLPDPFTRIALLQWLNNRFREFGPNRTKGYHKVSNLVSALQSEGHSRKRILAEIESLTRSDCILSESQSNEIKEDDLVSISPSGFIHLDLLRNINYLSAVAEDTYFRENQIAKKIADNLIGRGKFKPLSRQSDISSSKILVDYMSSYYSDHFLGSSKILADEFKEDLIGIASLKLYVDQVADNDSMYASVQNRETAYPPGLQIEAQIVSVQDYGFFVEFGLNGTGLVHKSNFKDHDHTILETIEEGDWTIVEIIEFNQEHDRYYLKLVDM